MFKPHHLPESPVSGNGPYLSSNFRCCSVQRIIGYPQLGQVETIILLKFGSTKSPDLIYPTGKINTFALHKVTLSIKSCSVSFTGYSTHSHSPQVLAQTDQGDASAPLKPPHLEECGACIALPCGLDMQLISAMHLPGNIIIQNRVPHNLLWCILHTKIAILGCTV